MGYKSKEEQREYQRNWLQKRRNSWIASKGSKCERCGKEDLPFEVDHIDRNSKVDHKVWSWSKERRELELSKCQLLCQLCHWSKTAEENSGLTYNHGTSTAYQYGCRCVECVLEKKRINSLRY